MSVPAMDGYMSVPHRKPIVNRASFGGQIPYSPQQQPPPAHATTPPMQMASSFNPNPARRTLSNATASTSSTSSSQHKHPSSVRRSGSTRSSNSASSYVAMLRRQKATVWSDRSQTEDPRLQAAQRLAKERASREVAGAYAPGTRLQAVSSSASGGGSFTGGVARKIRHHGAQKTSTFTAGNLAGAGVPMRLSANEVEDEDQSPGEREWEKTVNDPWAPPPQAGPGVSGQERPNHQRTASGKSSLGSARHRHPLPSSVHNPALRHSTASSARSSLHSRSPSDAGLGLHGVSEETSLQQQPATTQQGQLVRDADAEYFPRRTRTGGSNHSSGSGEASFGGLGSMPVRSRPAAGQQKRESADELRRRGSVDERSMTMSAGVRLFVANPDVDSD